MNTPASPLSTPDSVVEQLASELKRQLGQLDGKAGSLRATLAWYMNCGLNHAVSRHSLLFALNEQPDLMRLTSDLTTEEIAQAKPPPEFDEGQRVEVVMNSRNLTPHSGVITARIWHHKYQKWLYFIHENGKRVSKRYEAHDLRPHEA